MVCRRSRSCSAVSPWRFSFSESRPSEPTVDLLLAVCLTSAFYTFPCRHKFPRDPGNRPWQPPDRHLLRSTAARCGWWDKCLFDQSEHEKKLLGRWTILYVCLNLITTQNRANITSLQNLGTEKKSNRLLMQVLARTLIDTVLFPCSHNRVRLNTSMGGVGVGEGGGW